MRGRTDPEFGDAGSTPAGKPGSLVPLELAILDIASARSGPIHGFELAKALAGSERSRTLTSHGTLYKALGRLAEAGLLEAEWEAP